MPLQKWVDTNVLLWVVKKEGIHKRPLFLPWGTIVCSQAPGSTNTMYGTTISRRRIIPIIIFSVYWKHNRRKRRRLFFPPGSTTVPNWWVMDWPKQAALLSIII